MNSSVIIDNRSKEKLYKILKKNNLTFVFNKAITVLKTDPQAGKRVNKDRIPKELIKKYHINNLFIYDLVRKHPGWRLLYTIKPNGKVKILVVVLEVLKHKKYDRLFRY